MSSLARLSLLWFFTVIIISGAGRAMAAETPSDSITVLLARAKHDDAQAEFLLGWDYYMGDGASPDDRAAARWLRKAALHGNAEAQFYLGQMYEYGRGVRASNGEAVRWFRKAADQNNALAQSALGSMYAEGWGVPRNNRQACFWLMVASLAGRTSTAMNCSEISGLTPADIEAVRREALAWHSPVAAAPPVRPARLARHKG